MCFAIINHKFKVLKETKEFLSKLYVWLIIKTMFPVNLFIPLKSCTQSMLYINKIIYLLYPFLYQLPTKLGQQLKFGFLENKQEFTN